MDVLKEFGEALSEFAIPEDLKRENNPSVQHIRDKKGIERTSFRRKNNINPSLENRVLKAILDFEEGKGEALVGISKELGEEGVEMLIQELARTEKGKSMINLIILKSRGDIFKILGINSSQ